MTKPGNNDGWIDDLVAMILQQSIDHTQDIELSLIGNVIEYDVKTHMCRVLLPTRRAQDASGNDQLMETGWCKVGSPIVGNGWGLQYCLTGGATAQNSAGGEEVEVSVQDRGSGLCVVANLTFNDTMHPPGGGSDTADSAETDTAGTQQLQAAEFILKHKSGTFFKFYKNGDVRLTSTGSLYAQVQNDCNVTVVEGDANINVEQGDIAIDASTGSVSITGGDEIDVNAPVVNVNSPEVNLGESNLQQLANLHHILETYNVHTHSSFSSPPNPQGVEGTDTTVNVKAT